MAKYEIDVGAEFPLGARLARKFGEHAHGFMGRIFAGGLLFVSLASIAVSHPGTMLAVLLALILAGKAHRHQHAHRWHHACHGASERYWRRDVVDEDFL